MSSGPKYDSYTVRLNEKRASSHIIKGYRGRVLKYGADEEDEGYE